MGDTSDGNTSERDRGGRFVNGGKPGPGRPVGARSRLGQAFLEDLADTWRVHGITALRRAAVEDPAGFVRVVAGLLPRQAQVDVDVTHGIDGMAVLTSFREAVALLQADAPQPPAKAKVIDGRRP